MPKGSSPHREAEAGGAPGGSWGAPSTAGWDWNQSPHPKDIFCAPREESPSWRSCFGARLRSEGALRLQAQTVRAAVMPHRAACLPMGTAEHPQEVHECAWMDKLTQVSKAKLNTAVKFKGGGSASASVQPHGLCDVSYTNLASTGASKRVWKYCWLCLLCLTSRCWKTRRFIAR